jgi:hypothetical protein
MNDHDGPYKVEIKDGEAIVSGPGADHFLQTVPNSTTKFAINIVRALNIAFNAGRDFMEEGKK